MDILPKQQTTYELLIDRFGPEVKLSSDLYKKVANGTASEAEYIEYQAKADSLTERVQKFYRETDIAKIDKMPDRDVDVLIAMLNTGFTVTQSQTTHITKVMNNSVMEKRLTEAVSNKPVSVSGFIGSSEATEALSPQQQATTLGLDYESRDRETGEIKRDFLLKTGTDNQGNPKYEPIPQTCYMKIPYTDELKDKTLMTIDVRLYEKILERAERTKQAGVSLSPIDKTIATMAKEISERDVCLKYKSDSTESDEEAKKKCEEFSQKYQSKVKGKVTADKPPFTGLGFSSFGEKIGAGFMNMHPEMNIAVKLDQNNYHKYVGSGEVEFYAKFAKDDTNLDTYKPQGSTDVLMGKWDGKKVTIPDNAKEDYEGHFLRVKEKFSEDNQNKLRSQKLSINRVKLKLDILPKQQTTYELLIDRFGPEVKLSSDLYKKVANGTASEAEYIEYQAKADSLTERVQKFYRETDIAKIDKMPDRDVDVLIAMLNTGFTVTQSQTTHITKVMNNSVMEKRLTEAVSNKPVSVSGFIGSSEATEALSPQQQATTLGLDYESRDRETGEIKRDFLLKTGTDNQGNPKYEPIPQTCYMKIPYTDELKDKTLMTIDVRLYEKILERAERTKQAGVSLSPIDKTIATMAKEISERDVCLKYKSDSTESDEEAKKKCEEFSQKYQSKVKGKVTADKPPFTGLGFSSFGEKIGAGFMNMHPEMNIAVKLDQNNYHKYVGSGEVEFYAKFAKDDTNLDTYKPQGSTDVLMGKWDGKKVTIPDNAKEDYEGHFLRVKEKFSEDNQNRLRTQKLSVDRVKLNIADENEKKDNVPDAVKEQIKKDGHLILSKNKELSNKSRETLAEEHEKKCKKEEEEKINDNREKVSLSDEQNKRKKKRKNQETEEKSNENSKS